MTTPTTSEIIALSATIEKIPSIPGLSESRCRDYAALQKAGVQSPTGSQLNAIKYSRSNGVIFEDFAAATKKAAKTSSLIMAAMSRLNTAAGNALAACEAEILTANWKP